MLLAYRSCSSLEKLWESLDMCLTFFGSWLFRHPCLGSRLSITFNMGSFGHPNCVFAVCSDRPPKIQIFGDLRFVDGATCASTFQKAITAIPVAVLLFLNRELFDRRARWSFSSETETSKNINSKPFQSDSRRKQKNTKSSKESSSQKEALLYSHVSTGFKSRQSFFRRRTDPIFDLNTNDPIFLRKRNYSALVWSLFTRASGFFKTCDRNHKNSFTNETNTRESAWYIWLSIKLSRSRECSIII